MTHDLGIGPEGAICLANDASAFGVALATGEVERDQVFDTKVRTDYSLYSDVAFTSSELPASGLSTGRRAASVRHGCLLCRLEGTARSIQIENRPQRLCPRTQLADPLYRLGQHDHLGPRLSPPAVVYVVSKMTFRIHQISMGVARRSTTNPHRYHVAKALGGYLVAPPTGATVAFVSGGEHNSHRGPPDDNPLAVVVRLPSESYR